MISITFCRIKYEKLITRTSLVGAVYLGSDSATNRQIIIKRIPTVRFKDEDPLQKALRIDKIFKEFKFLSTLHHKNIISYLNVAASEETLDIFQEFGSNRTLLNSMLKNREYF